MTGRTILAAVSAVALASSAAGTALAQSKDKDPRESVPEKIRDRLAADGYQDIEVAPGSYVVSAKDRNGQRVMMLIGPTSMTMMKVPDEPSTAQVPDGHKQVPDRDKDEIIQQ